MGEKIEIEINDDGTFGALPDPIQKFVNREIANAKRAARAEAAAVPSPVDLERLKAAESELTALKQKEAERLGEYQKARELAEATWKKEISAEKQRAEAAEAKARETARAKLAAEIKAEALKAGADPDSIDDFVTLAVASGIDFDAELKPVIQKDGTADPLDVGGFVESLLDAKPYFKRATKPAGSGARGGYSVHGGTVDAKTASLQQALRDAQARVQANPADTTAVNAVFEATRALREHGAAAR